MKRKTYPLSRARGRLASFQTFWAVWKNPYWNMGVICLLSYQLLSVKVPDFDWTHIWKPKDQLYLLDEAGRFIPDTESFSSKVKEVSQELQVPPEWIMAVMKAESGFNPTVRNKKGSGAVGLIQFMPAVAKELQVRPSELAQMEAHIQMDFVQQYLQQVRARYGEYQSLTDLYLGILYPKARYQDPCFALYAKPSKSYIQNAGLDENGDGVVSIHDIDQRMKRMFPIAYMINKEKG